MRIVGLRFSLNKPGKAPPSCPPSASVPVIPSTILPLECLRPGEWAEVFDVSGEPSWVGRLAELGIRVGARLQMLRDGSPCLVLVGDGRLSLRGEAALQVLVCPVVEV